MNLRQTRHYKIRTAMKQEQVPEADSSSALHIHILFSVLPIRTAVLACQDWSTDLSKQQYQPIRTGDEIVSFENGNISIEDFERIALRQ